MNSIHPTRPVGAVLSVAAAVTFALYGSAGWAQQAGSAAAANSGSSEDTGQLEEVVITAQKRTEKLEDVPVSANVVSNSLLQSSNVSDVSDLNKLVPSVNINGTISGRAPMGIRGISSVSNEQAVGVPSGVAIMVDGVPIPSDSYDGNQIEDMQNVEVLEGPQATLGGRTAASGIINYNTYDPTDHFTGGVSGTATTDREFRGNGHISGPITDSLEFSFSGYDSHRYYPITNIFYGTKADQHTSGLRAKLLWKISDDIEAKFTYHHGRVNAGGFNFVYTYLTPGVSLLFPGPLTQASLFNGITPSWKNLQYNSPVPDAGHTQDDNDAQLDLSFNLGGGYTLTSTTAWQHEDQTQVQDLFAVDYYFFDTLFAGAFADPIVSNPGAQNNTQWQFEKIQQKSEELKLVSPLDQPVSFVAGVFYSGTSVHMLYFRGFPPTTGAAVNIDVTPTTSTYDVYGRATWKFAQSTSLVVGARYNYDVLKYDYDQYTYNGQGPWFSNASNNSSAIVGDISLQQQFAPDVMGYLTYSRGYSPKVYNTAATLTSDAALTPTGQEHINDFEIGTKGSYFDRRLTVNLALFDTIYQDYQIQDYTLLPGQITSSLNLSSAGQASTHGAELSSSMRASEYTTLTANAAYVDAVFGNWQDAPCQGFPAVGVNPANCTQNSSGEWVQTMSGKAMPNAPHWKLFLDGQQRIPLAGAPVELLADANFAYRTRAQMLPDNDPQGVMGAFGILNASLGIQSVDGKWSLTAFCNNIFNRIYYQDVEDFWTGPWQNTSTVIAQPARDAQRYGGLRFNASF